MAEHKPKFNSAQSNFFPELLPKDFTSQNLSTRDSSSSDDLDSFLDDMHQTHQAHRLRASSIVYWDYIKTDYRPRTRDRIRNLQAMGVIPTESEKKTRLRKVGTPVISLVLKKLGLSQIVEERGYTPEAITKIHAETSKLNIKTEVNDLQLACDYFLWLKRKHKKI